MKIELEVSDKFKGFLEYIETYLFIDTPTYLTKIIEQELSSRNFDLNLV